MLHEFPFWTTLLVGIALQGIVLLVTGLPILAARRRGETVDPETRRAFRGTNLGVAAVLLILFDVLGILRLLGIDPMMALAGAFVWFTDFLRSW